MTDDVVPVAGLIVGEPNPRRYYAMRHALREIARAGCSRLVDPSTCRAPNGYPRAEWCEGCIAAEGLGLPRDWYVLKP